MIIDELNKKIADIESLANDKTSTIESKVSDLTDGLLMVADAVDIIPEMVDEKITAITKEFSTIKDTVSKVKAQKGEKGAKGDKGDKGDTGATGADGKDGSPDTGEQIADKLNELEGVLDTKVLKDFSMPDIKDLERQINTIGNQTLRLLSRPTSSGGTGTTTTINGLSGDVTLSAGNNITLGETGNNIEISANFTQSGKYMISGGATWSGTGLVYDVSFLNYFFDGLKTANASQVTLAASDPTNNRIDAIVVDEAGTVSVITGDAAASPVEPPIPEDQLQVQFVLVEAGSTTPTVLSESIYLDDPTSNWTFSTYTTGAATGSINFAGTNSPKQGVNDIEASTDARLGARFVRGTSFDPYQYTMMSVWVRFTGTAVATNKSLNVRFENSAGTLVGSNVNLFSFGLSRSILNTWQLVVVPITAFGALPATVKGLKMIMGGGTVGQVRQWDIDYMILTNGSVPQANVPTIVFAKDGTNIASQSGINLIEGTGVTITGVNNPTLNRVDYTINASGSLSGTPTQIPYFDSLGAITSDANFTRDETTQETFIKSEDISIGLSQIQLTNNLASIVSFDSNTLEVGRLRASPTNAFILYSDNVSITNTASISVDGVTFDFSGDSYTFPIGDGTAGQALVTDGAGTLSWASGGTSPITIGTSGNTLYSSGLTLTGEGDTSTGNNIILGVQAGRSSAAYHSIFLGQNAGRSSSTSYNSIFLGQSAGFGASKANNSIFLGQSAGQSASVGANNSIFIGNNSGINDTVDNSSSGTSILIGDDTSTGGFSNSIAIGKSATNSAANQMMIGSAGSLINYLLLNSSGHGLYQTSNSISIGSVSGGSDTKITINDATQRIKLTNVPAYNSESDALAAGLTTGDVWQTTAVDPDIGVPGFLRIIP